ncbi:baseplate J/gp47 family protein [Solibacillus sp. A46]|uniref:Baseplate J/gp47 family protein n=1 Tax=Solibacillus faecavium TaxID=2762221 RepID=A0ABR8XYR3_9BACL|nr:baseplate J/gp47 family protein [Solibacillus faecavium]MBD8037078.1 baseplate J/gp47 family protein [Solibacillus faecavium]
MTQPFNLDSTLEDIQAIKRTNVAELDERLDMRETSPLYNATAVNSIEIIQMLTTLKNYVDMVFADTAPRETLIRRMAERGLTPKPATKAKWRAIFNIDVPIGARFSLDRLNYTVIEKISNGQFILECETYGVIGNTEYGTLIPINYIDGLQTAQLVELLVPGEDEEDTEVMRRRYFNSFGSVSFGGNRADYKEKTLAQPGVGGVRVYRAWGGGGTVKLVIINSLYQKPTQTLVADVQEAVDPLYAQGEGLGYAPIDHSVTVFAVDEVSINIGLNITYQAGWTWDDIQANVQSVIEDYFVELAKEWAESEEDNAGLVIRISQIEYRLLNVSGVLDIANTQLNGGTANVQIAPDAIPKVGVING